MLSELHRFPPLIAEAPMNVTAMVESLHALSGANRQRLRGEVQKLVRLTEAQSPLDTFLRQALEVIHPLYAATASVFWIRDKSGSIQPVTRKGFRSSSLSEANISALNLCAEQYWKEDTPTFCWPSDDRPRTLVSPLRNKKEEPVGALQLVLSEDSFNEAGKVTNNRSETPDTARFYRQAAIATVSILQAAISQKLTVQSITLPQAEAGLQVVQQQISTIQRTIRTTIQGYLQSLNGAAFDSFEENQAFIRKVQALLDANSLRIECPECGHPAILRCARNASVATGVFVFDHYLPEGRTFHGGGKILPEIRVVARPARRSSGS